MLARAVDRLPRSDQLPGGTWYEPKWDGFRVIASCIGERVALRSRRGTDLTDAFPEIASALADQVADVILDGELVVWNAGGLDFISLQRRMTTARAAAAHRAAETPANLVVFDVLSVAAQDTRSWPYRDRRRALEHLPLAPPLSITPATTDPVEAMEWFQSYAAAGVEGLVAKGATQRYVGGQRGWLKFRHRHTTEAVVGAVDGQVGHPKRLVLGAWNDAGELRIVGGTSVLSSSAAAEVAHHLRPASGPHPWEPHVAGHLLGGLAGQHGAIDISRTDPDTVVEVDVDTAFDRSRWRHPVRLRRVRTDTDPRSVTLDALAGDR